MKMKYTVTLEFELEVEGAEIKKNDLKGLCDDGVIETCYTAVLFDDDPQEVQAFISSLEVVRSKIKKAV